MRTGDRPDVQKLHLGTLFLQEASVSSPHLLSELRKNINERIVDLCEECLSPVVPENPAQ